MAWRGGFQNRFVAASSSSSSTSSVSNDPTKRFPSMSGSMNSVPPPMNLTMPNAAALLTGASVPRTAAVPADPVLAARELQRKKEEEYANLMSGTKKIEQERKRRLYDDEYLEKEDDDEEESNRKSDRRSSSSSSSSRHDRHSDRHHDSRHRHSSPSRDERKKESKKVEEEEEEEDDPLEAFMAGINKQATKEKEESIKKDKERISGKEVKISEEDEKKKLGRADIDEEDMQESYFKFLEEKKASAPEEEEIYEYDEDGNIIWTWKKVIDPLPPLDHSTVQYADFHKNFYVEHEDIQKLTFMDVVRLRDTLGLRVGGAGAPKPVASFAHFGFDQRLMHEISKMEFEHPTPIQAQAIPAALMGRDVLGIAKTGSGKTAAYLWPAITHIMDQPELKPDDGPIALVVVPTRELAIQVYNEAKRFCRAFNINVICAYGGGSKWEQQNELKDQGAELVVCTPGRIIDLVKIEATNFTRVTYLVFDEADRMFDMGFEAQVMSISNHIRPDRQCLMFSATFKQKVERLAREALQDPVRIVQGEVGEANADVAQIVEVLPSQDAKWRWLCDRLVEFVAAGKVLIFVTKKANAEDVANRLKTRDFKLVLLHGDMQQHERNEHLKTFRKEIDIMVATDVAARGLDIPEIRTVINYDIARDIDTHVHRIGRTGRAGQKGWAFTLITEADKEMAGHYVRNLESVNADVPPALLNLALKAQWFRASRKEDGTAGNTGRPRFGLGYKEKQKALPGPGGSRDPLTANLRAPPPPPPVGAGAIGGPPTAGRVSLMKNAFKHSFQMSFRPSESADVTLAAPSDPRPEWKRKIDELNAKIQCEQREATESNSDATATPASGVLGGGVPKKRSRWGT